MFRLDLTVSRGIGLVDSVDSSQTNPELMIVASIVTSNHQSKQFLIMQKEGMFLELIKNFSPFYSLINNSR